jgi:hypothetical protein
VSTDTDAGHGLSPFANKAEFNLLCMFEATRRNGRPSGGLCAGTMRWKCPPDTLRYPGKSWRCEPEVITRLTLHTFGMFGSTSQNLKSGAKLVTTDAKAKEGAAKGRDHPVNSCMTTGRPAPER